MVSDPADCSKYYTCHNGAAVSSGTCSVGLLWDAVNNVCNWANQVVCPTTTPATATGEE